MSRLRNLFVACLTFSSIVAPSAAIANAQTESSQVNPQTEGAESIDAWVKSLKLGDVCPANITIYIPPSGSSTNISNPFIPSFGGVHQQVTMTNYPKNVVVSLPYNALWTTGLLTYNESRDSGIRNAKIALSLINKQCPNSRIHLYGYSEGADVGAHIVQSISRNAGPIPKDTLGAAVFQGNPVRNTNGTHSAGSAPHGTGLFAPVDYGDQADKVMEVCNKDDVVCNTSNVAPTLYYIYGDFIANSAPLRGQFDLRSAVARYNPETTVRSAAEVPASVYGWGRHIADYSVLTPHVRDQGEDFIRSRSQ